MAVITKDCVQFRDILQANQRFTSKGSEVWSNEQETFTLSQIF